MPGSVWRRAEDSGSWPDDGTGVTVGVERVWAKPPVETPAIARAAARKPTVVLRQKDRRMWAPGRVRSPVLPVATKAFGVICQPVVRFELAVLPITILLDLHLVHAMRKWRCRMYLQVRAASIDVAARLSTLCNYVDTQCN